ncbi:orotate phosphoribosyltransferase [Listeria cossartiae subsp. cayugensis]|uniref:Orotate phosphoribosyltransferase n=1 Tax=Listeria cossartiae subsp. cayugensis TaxID=2713505 RepID=A0ABU2IMY2_9LIST|nr:orotate phosphoribosyltransferase [Listeria cossartiae]MDT0049538.1 orotate phosphoribosyltransferase [Listeria cossartiae subsp. cayugensis]MDT0066041.1 orotate phosphoribosyltransferase [Listeria cossartiae subsp. cayugensis]MDT0079930.1 orotate phosphoribosyltransferase [Listeria cossartiae subsp. cayugensis]MDT0083237.1 orotate phosphoribosyltransferase [Listeria cossartiae subsp. cayugensis]MDT0088671.1 orotate phosphoribosyltransferase [Listeria cossartiae subsp. cayugensis]
MSIEKQVAEQLLAIKAVFLKPNEPFTWASGIKSPIYCDNRLTLGFPKVRQFIAQSLAEKIKQTFGEVDVVAGTATAGIPHAAWVSDLLDLPMVYVRSKAKEHGKGNQIEGPIAKGQKVVVIEDLISTGGSSLKAVEALEEAGAEVVGIAAIFTYGLGKGKKLLEEADTKLVTLTNYDELIEVALNEKYVTPEDMATLKEWKKNPEIWSK